MHLIAFEPSITRHQDFSNVVVKRIAQLLQPLIRKASTSARTMLLCSSTTVCRSSYVFGMIRIVSVIGLCNLKASKQSGGGPSEKQYGKADDDHRGAQDKVTMTSPRRETEGADESHRSTETCKPHSMLLFKAEART